MEEQIDYMFTDEELSLLLATQYPQDFALLLDDSLTCIQYAGNPIYVNDADCATYRQMDIGGIFISDFADALTGQIQNLGKVKDSRWLWQGSHGTVRRLHTVSHGCVYLVVIQPCDTPPSPLDHLSLTPIPPGPRDLVCRITATGILIHVNQAMLDFWNSPATDLISTSFFRYCVEYEVPTLNHKLKNLSRSKPSFVIDIRMKNGYQPQRWVKWSFHAIFDPSGNLAEVQGVGYDITDHQRAQVAEQRQRNLAEALRNISTVLNSSLELDTVLEHIIEIIDLVVSHDTVNVMLVEDFYATVVRANGYSNHNIRGIMSLKLRIAQTDHLRYMMETKSELVIPNVETHPDPCMGIPEMCWVKSYVGAPIISEDQVIGFLNLESMTPYYFEMEHGKLVRAFANHAAIAIRNAQLYKQAQRVAIIEERQRLARELHDAVSQTLFSANMIADSLPMLYQKQPADVFPQLKLLRQQTQLAMSELRAMLFELRPQTLADTDMQQLLEQLVQSFAGRGLVDTTLTVENDDTQILLEPKIAFYRIAQEAINNAIQHAHATHIEVRFVADDSHYAMTIRDNGQGFDITAQRPGHMGLQIMQDRAHSIGAQLTIESNNKTGTHIDIVYPRQRKST